MTAARLSPTMRSAAELDLCIRVPPAPRGEAAREKEWASFTRSHYPRSCAARSARLGWHTTICAAAHTVQINTIVTSCSEHLSATAAAQEQHPLSPATALLPAMRVDIEAAKRPTAGKASTTERKHSVEMTCLSGDDSDDSRDPGTATRRATRSEPVAHTAHLAESAPHLRNLINKMHRLSVVHHPTTRRRAALSNIPEELATLQAPPMSLDAHLLEIRLGHAGAAAVRRQRVTKIQSDL
jgi:hypothetical protein